MIHGYTTYLPSHKFEYSKTMCGVDSMMLNVRNSATYNFSPMWTYTDERIPAFLAANVHKGWSKVQIGMMVEGFVLLQCDLGGE